MKIGVRPLGIRGNPVASAGGYIGGDADAALGKSSQSICLGHEHVCTEPSILFMRIPSRG